jgi:hypothetical protein
MLKLDTLTHAIIAKAEHFQGLKEIKANAKWDDPKTPGPDARAAELKALLEGVKWQPGWAYCLAFCKAIWLEAYRELGAPSDLRRMLDDRLSLHVVGSYNALKPSISNLPRPGAIFFMKKGNTIQGHSGIVTGVQVERGIMTITTIEANTSNTEASAAKDREGDWVCKKERRVSFTETPGLYFLGFLNPFADPKLI